jgi:hypothetical protein
MGSFVTDCVRAGPYSVKWQGKECKIFAFVHLFFSSALQFDFPADNK